MRLREYLRPELVLLDLKAKGVQDAIQAMVGRIRMQDVVADAAELERALLDRESVHTTAMGSGVAVPHATVHGLGRPVVAVAISRDGVAFGPVGLDPVHVFFVLLSPPDQTGLHIKLLARIARLVRHPGFVARLRHATNAESVLEALEHVDAGHV
ncbi:MAG TPA: PTS sugar transporter subunit IIA [Longimicrobiales bacterium]